MQVTMALLTGLGESRVDEFMVHNRQSGQTSFYKVGDDFDGGELVFVHQTGGVVHRRDGYFVYPLGATLDHAVEAAQATDFPDLQGVRLSGIRLRFGRPLKPPPKASLWSSRRH